MEYIKLDVGTNVIIEFEDGDQYPSVIQEIDEKGENIYINAFSKFDCSNLPEKGTYLKIMVHMSNCCYLLLGSVEGYKTLDSVRVMHVVRRDKIERIQRRMSYRLEKSLPVDLKIYDLYNINQVERSVAITTADISEGGLGFYWPEPLEPNRFLDCGITIGDDYFMLRCSVVRCIEEDERIFRIGLKIIDDSEEFKDRVRKYVFDEQVR